MKIITRFLRSLDVLTVAFVAFGLLVFIFVAILARL